MFATQSPKTLRPLPTKCVVSGGPQQPKVEAIGHTTKHGRQSAVKLMSSHKNKAYE